MTRAPPDLAGHPALPARARAPARVPRHHAVQPIIWLLLFGALFKAVTEIPGFDGGSYIDFLTPGVVVMLAVSRAPAGPAWASSRTSTRGVMDRMLVSPVWRGALNLGSVAYADDHDRHPDGADRAARAGARRALRQRRRRRAHPACSSRRCSAAAFASLSNGIGVLAAPARDADRRGQPRAAAADVPVLGADAAEPRARLDPHRREVQPGQLGRRGRPLGGDAEASTGASWPAASACSSALVVLVRVRSRRARSATYQRSL